MQIAEICSVSTCLMPAPEGWIDRWLHNALGFFNTRRDALAVLNGPGDFRLFGYRLLPFRFTKGGREPFEIGRHPIEPLPAEFEPLGFDVVSKSVSSFFECSPLSCNGMARELPVNRFCLLETLAEAIAAAERFAREEPEPGPYYVFEVLREEQRRDARVDS